MPRAASLGFVLLQIGAASALLAQAGQSSDQQSPVFRAGADTVAIYATVVDRSGLPVLDLTRDDFRVFDDGQRRPLTVFENGLQAITAVLLLDTSASMTLNLDLARGAAEQFLIRMLPGDRARVGTFSDRIDLGERFTEDRDELLRTLRDRFRIGNPTRLWDAIDGAMTDLAPLSGRRIVLLLTDGMDTISRLRGDQVLARAREHDLMIYVVQFRSSARAQLAELTQAPTVSEALGLDSRPRPGFSSELLRRLAMQTGGSHFMLGQHDDLNATFTYVMQELHYQYVLGFTPVVPDGKVHSLDVRVGRPNVTVRARRSYLAPKPAEPTEEDRP